MKEQQIANRIARSYFSKQRPPDMFKGVFFDIKERAKEYIKEQSTKAIAHLSNTLKADLAKRGLKGTADIKLGRFKGHPFVTSSKIITQPTPPFSGPDDPRVQELLAYLQQKYSPKFKLKKIIEGAAVFNVR